MDEDHLVDSGFLESARVLAHLRRCAHAVAQPGGIACSLLGAERVDARALTDRCRDRLWIVVLGGAAFDVLRPNIGPAGAVLAEHVEVTRTGNARGVAWDPSYRQRRTPLTHSRLSPPNASAPPKRPIVSGTVDINPLIVTEAGLVAVDALIIACTNRQ